MTYSVILHVPRKPGINSEEFKHHWENVHVPLVKTLVGHEFPLSYTRHYIERPLYSPPSSPSPVDPALDQAGTITTDAQGFIDVDGVAVLTFANKEHYDKFSAKLVEAKKNHVYKEDLGGFVDVAALKAMFAGETKATGRDGGVVGWRFVGSF